MERTEQNGADESPSQWCVVFFRCLLGATRNRKRKKESDKKWKNRARQLKHLDKMRIYCVNA